MILFFLFPSLASSFISIRGMGYLFLLPCPAIFLFLFLGFLFFLDSGHGKLFSSPMPRSFPFSLPWLPLLSQFGAWGIFFLLPCPALFLFLFLGFPFFLNSGHGKPFSSPMPRSFPFSLPWLSLLSRFGAWVTFFFSHAPLSSLASPFITIRGMGNFFLLPCPVCPH